MTTSTTRRSASLVRTALVLLSFTVLAAVGFASARELSPAAISASASLTNHASQMPAATPHRDAFHAPAAAPMPAHVFSHR